MSTTVTILQSSPSTKEALEEIEMQELKVSEIKEDMDEMDAKAEMERNFWTKLWQGIAASSLGLNIVSTKQ